MSADAATRPTPTNCTSLGTAPPDSAYVLPAVPWCGIQDVSIIAPATLLGVLSIRDRALAAAVDLLGTQGLRVLSHAGVDTSARPPRGSTSNYCRTRAALVEGVIGWVAQNELGDFEPGFDPDTATPDDLVDAFCDLLKVQTGTFRSRTIARYLLFLEAARDEGIWAPLVPNRQLFEQCDTVTMTALGAPDPKTSAIAFMAFGEGLILHRLTVNEHAEIRPAVALIVRACLASEPESSPPPLDNLPHPR